MIVCYACKQKISVAAKACKFCGEPQQRPKRTYQTPSYGQKSLETFS